MKLPWQLSWNQFPLWVFWDKNSKNSSIPPSPCRISPISPPALLPPSSSSSTPVWPLSGLYSILLHFLSFFAPSPPPAFILSFFCFFTVRLSPLLLICERLLGDPLDFGVLESTATEDEGRRVEEETVERERERPGLCPTFFTLSFIFFFLFFLVCLDSASILTWWIGYKYFSYLLDSGDRLWGRKDEKKKMKRKKKKNWASRI